MVMKGPEAGNYIWGSNGAPTIAAPATP
jgi:hypothetical protein